MKRLVLVLILGIAGLLASACNPIPRVDSVQLANPSQAPALGQPVDFSVSGFGSCTLTVDWGDGTPTQQVYKTIGIGPPQLTHTYNGWAGGKTVTVHGGTNCPGTARTRFTIAPSTWTIGWAVRDSAGQVLTCVRVPGKPQLAPNSLVKVTADTYPYVKFAYAIDARKFDPDGWPGTSAVSPFPFEGFREFSLVLRVGSELFQGGTNTRFVTTTGGVLEMCQNDYDTTDNSGGWSIRFEVDELGPDL